VLDYPVSGRHRWTRTRNQKNKYVGILKLKVGEAARCMPKTKLEARKLKSQKVGDPESQKARIQKTACIGQQHILLQRHSLHAWEELARNLVTNQCASCTKGSGNKCLGC